MMWKQKLDFVCITCREFKTARKKEILMARTGKKRGLEILKSVGWCQYKGKLTNEISVVRLLNLVYKS